MAPGAPAPRTVPSAGAAEAAVAPRKPAAVAAAVVGTMPAAIRRRYPRDCFMERVLLDQSWRDFVGHSGVGGARPDDNYFSGRREPRRTRAVAGRLRVVGTAQPTFTVKTGLAASFRNEASACGELSTRVSPPPGGLWASKYTMPLMAGMVASAGSTES